MYILHAVVRGREEVFGTMSLCNELVSRAFRLQADMGLCGLLEE